MGLNQILVKYLRVYPLGLVKVPYDQDPGNPALRSKGAKLFGLRDFGGPGFWDVRTSQHSNPIEGNLLTRLPESLTNNWWFLISYHGIHPIIKP
jgi:hypothetical protein